MRWERQSSMHHEHLQQGSWTFGVRLSRKEKLKVGYVEVAVPHKQLNKLDSRNMRARLRLVRIVTTFEHAKRDRAARGHAWGPAAACAMYLEWLGDVCMVHHMTRMTQGASPDTIAAAVYTSLKRRLGIKYARCRSSESTKVVAKNVAAPAPNRYLDATEARKMLCGKAAMTPPCRSAMLPKEQPAVADVIREGAKGNSRFAACRNINILQIGIKTWF